MDDNEIRRIVRETVFETLSGLGVEAHHQQEVQADFLYLRKMRKGSEALSLTIRTATLTFFIPTLLYMLWESIRRALGK